MTASMNDDGLFWAARSRAPHHGASSAPVARLRSYLHQQLVLSEVPDDNAGDVAGRLLDEIEEHEFLQVGDLISGNATDIPWYVVQVEDSEGYTWDRAFGDDRFGRDLDGAIEYDQEYDWIHLFDGEAAGMSTTCGVLAYAPLRVTQVARRPGEGDDR